MKNYQETLKYIHSLPKLQRTAGLEPIKKVLKLLGDPQNSYPTIHITGTNGKGSTCNYLANLLEATGQKVGMFTSPFVKEFNERIQINHQEIKNDELIQLVDKIQKVSQGIILTEFEFVTIIGFLYFRDKVDVAVIEVGIGATHDKTNVIKPDVSILTSIDMDHEKIIGPTLLDIAKEKSGIIKTDTPVVTGSLQDNIRPIIANKARESNSKMLEFGVDFGIKNFEIENFQVNFAYYDDKYQIDDIICKGFEKTTAMNAAIAIRSFICYQILHNNEINLELIKESIDVNRPLGRMQIVQEKPLVLLDGSHNPSAITNLIDSLRNNWSNKDIIVLYAGMRDKDRKDILDYLSKNVSNVLVTKLNMNRSANRSDYDFSEYKNVIFVDDYRDTLLELRNKLSDNQILLVTGSFYLVSDLENIFS